MYRVLLSGIEPDSGNRGCRALSWSLVHLIKQQRGDAEIRYITTRPPEAGTVTDQLHPVSYLRTRTSPRYLLPLVLGRHLCGALLYRLLPIGGVRRLIARSDEFIGALVESDLVGDIRLGDSFSDIYGLPRLLFGSFPVMTAIILGKRPVLLPQTYGPYKSTLARWLASFIMRRSRVICARDEQSLGLAGSLAGNRNGHTKMLLCPDVAFTLKPKSPESPRITPSLPSGCRIVGLNLSTLLYNGSYGKRNSFGIRMNCAEWVNGLVDRLMAEEGLHILLVPHVLGTGVDDDVAVCKTVWEELCARHGERIHLLQGEYTEAETKSIIGLCDFFIGCRMHACVAALSQGIPAVGVAYSDKFASVFDTVGVRDAALDARKITTDDAVEFCIDRFKRREEARAVLTKHVDEARESVLSIFEEIITDA